MKVLIFVSPGRCGTTRIYEILENTLPREFIVKHQMAFSRFANVVGNLMYYFGQNEKVKEKLYGFIVSRYTELGSNMEILVGGKHFISSDPLTAMIIPRKWVKNENVCIVQITRKPEIFAESFFKFSRKKLKSFIAHNFIPFWQIGIFPFENTLNRKIKNKYKAVARKKEDFFKRSFSANPNYIKVDLHEIFESYFLESLVNRFFHQNVNINRYELSIRANKT